LSTDAIAVRCHPFQNSLWPQQHYICTHLRTLARTLTTRINWCKFLHFLFYFCPVVSDGRP